MPGKGHEHVPYGYPAPETYDDDTVTIVVSRKAAEDLYYAIAIALGSRAGYYGGWAPSKKGGRPLGVYPKGKACPDDVPPAKNTPHGDGPPPRSWRGPRS